MPRPKKKEPNRNDGRFEYKLSLGKSPSGKLIRKSFYSQESLEDAKQKAKEYELELEISNRMGLPVIKKDIGFSDWADIWIEKFIKGKVKDNTYSSNYEIPLRLHIKPYFKQALLTSIKPIHIQEFLDNEAKNNSVEHLKKMRLCLKKIFDTALENDLCFKNPVTSNITILQKGKKTEKRFYTPQQFDYVVTYAKTHPKGLPILIMLVCGLSRSELLGLKWEDVTEDYVIHVKRGVVEAKNTATNKWEVVIGSSPKNDFRVRDIPIPEWLYEKIMEKPRFVMLGGSKRNKTPLRRVETEFIFYGSTGNVQTPSNFTTTVLNPFMTDLHEYYLKKDIDIPILNGHELRHTAATLWALNKVDVYTIAKLGGWSDLKMISKVYGHADLETMRKNLGYDSPKTT